MTWNKPDLEVKPSLFLEKKPKLQRKLPLDWNVLYAKEEEWIQSKDVKPLF